MNHEIRALGELGTAFERVAAKRRSRWPLAVRRWQSMAVVAVVLVGSATGALAAAGVIHLGAPVTGANGPHSPSVGRGDVKPSTVKLLAVRAADPGGGPPWGMQFATTTRGLGCLTVGRVVDGELGVLGRDGAFRNDGAFHPLATGSSATSPACAPLDRQGRLILNADVGEVPASALSANGLSAGGCLGPNVHEPGGTFCPVRDERNLYYGMLGPQATSLTYASPDGTDHTLIPRGPNGAYLIVQRAVETPGSINAGMSVSLEPFAPITSITYRNGLRCNLTNPIASEARVCRIPPGFAAASTPHYTHAELASPVHATIRPAGRGRWSLTVSFVAHAAITSALSNYDMTLQVPHGAYGFSRDADIRSGTRVTYHMWAALPLAPGIDHGAITYYTSTSPGQPPFLAGPNGEGGILVGRFTIRVP